MPTQTMKVAVSLPKDTYAQVEALRHRLGLPRSATVAEALELWIKQHEEAERIAQYEAGYRRHPERLSELKVYERVGLETFTKESW